MEHIDMKNSLDSKLQINSICSITIRSGKRDIVEKPFLGEISISRPKSKTLFFQESGFYSKTFTKQRETVSHLLYSSLNAPCWSLLGMGRPSHPIQTFNFFSPRELSQIQTYQMFQFYIQKCTWSEWIQIIIQLAHSNQWSLHTIQPWRKQSNRFQSKSISLGFP